MSTKQRAEGFQNQCLFVIPDDFLGSHSGNPLFEHLRVLDIGLFPDAQYHFRRRELGCASAILLLCASGEGSYALDGKPAQTLRAGQAVLLPPGVPHEYSASEKAPWTIYWMHAQGALIKPYYAALHERQPLSVNPSQQEEATRLFHQCFQLLKHPIQTEGYFSLCQTAANIMGTILLASKQTQHPVTMKGEQAVKSALRFMKTQLHTSLTLADIASATNFSASHLHALFKRTTGKAPVEYFIHMKMQAASKQLYFTDQSIKDIAVEYGIHDPYYFSRIFKKTMGLSPQAYRNLIKG